QVRVRGRIESAGLATAAREPGGDVIDLRLAGGVPEPCAHEPAVPRGARVPREDQVGQARGRGQDLEAGPEPAPRAPQTLPFAEGSFPTGLDGEVHPRIRSLQDCEVAWFTEQERL